MVISQTIDTNNYLTPGVHHQAIAKPRGSAEASGSIGWGGVGVWMDGRVGERVGEWVGGCAALGSP